MKYQTKATPEGPYTSPYTTGNWYIVQTIANNQEVWSIVRDGQQPNQGLITPSLRDARAWMKDNGYQKKSLQSSTKALRMKYSKKGRQYGKFRRNAPLPVPSDTAFAHPKRGEDTAVRGR